MVAAHLLHCRAIENASKFSNLKACLDLTQPKQHRTGSSRLASLYYPKYPPHPTTPDAFYTTYYTRT